MSENEVIKCSKDGSLMVFTYESEKLKGDLVRVSLYYKCPVCGSKRDIEEVRIEKSNQGFIVTRRAYTILSQEPRTAQ
jgi:hypothetical protein